jgi:hypothetical protein
MASRIIRVEYFTTTVHDRFALDAPHPAILVQGDDGLGALVRIHAKLYEANVNV